MINNYEDFKEFVYQLTRINLSDYKERQMKRRIDSLVAKRNFTDYESYARALKSDKVIYDEFINYITINVSEFYRNPKQWEVMEKEVVPMLTKRSSQIKIWSAACSTGEEPYSLVMLLSKFIPLNQVRILATDIDNEVINKAKTGLYNPKSLEGLPPEFVSRFFTKEGELFRIKDEVKRCVDFQHHNLLEDRYPDNCDLIVCRNVLIYFTEEAKSEIYQKFNKALKVGGILFVGSTEQIILSSRYYLKSVNTFFYQKERDI